MRLLHPVTMLPSFSPDTQLKAIHRPATLRPLAATHHRVPHIMPQLPQVIHPSPMHHLLLPTLLQLHPVQHRRTVPTVLLLQHPTTQLLPNLATRPHLLPATLHQLPLATLHQLHQATLHLLHQATLLQLHQATLLLLHQAIPHQLLRVIRPHHRPVMVDIVKPWMAKNP